MLEVGSGQRQTEQAGRASRRAGIGGDPDGHLPRVAIASLVVGFGLFSYHRHEVNDRNAMAQSVARLYPVVAASNLQTLEDLNTIRHLSDPRPAPAPRAPDKQMEADPDTNELSCDELI